MIEMLVVVTIIVLLLAFSAPALNKTMQASKLSSAGETVFGALSEAQQIAYSQNVPVEVRFFKFTENFDKSAIYHSYQIFKVTQTTTGTGAAAVVKDVLVPVENLTRLPEGIIIVTNTQLSPALQGDGFDDIKSADSTIGYSGVSNAKFNAIRFLPDGTCRSVGTTTGGMAQMIFQKLSESYFTLTYDTGADITPENLPKNFVTIQIDPYTGKARSYKPGF